jgi:hypothetical protein
VVSGSYGGTFTAVRQIAADWHIAMQGSEGSSAPNIIKFFLFFEKIK